MILFEWVCSGDDFFERVCSGDDFFFNGFASVFDRWLGFQIGGVDWLIGGVDRWPGLGF